VFPSGPTGACAPRIGGGGAGGHKGRPCVDGGGVVMAETRAAPACVMATFGHSWPLFAGSPPAACFFL